MNYATGYAFHTKDIMQNFPTHKMKMTHQECKDKFGIDRKVLACRIFLYAVKIILLDIIRNNVTFCLPVTIKMCQISVVRTQGDKFGNARRNGKWLDVDFLNSNFSGYQLEFRYEASERIIKKPVYVSGWMKDIITENTNKGMQYY